MYCTCIHLSCAFECLWVDECLNKTVHVTVVHVCMCLYTCKYTYMRMCITMHACEWVCDCTCMHACVHVCVRAYICVCIHFCTESACKHVGNSALQRNMNIQIYAETFTFIISISFFVCLYFGEFAKWGNIFGTKLRTVR